MLATLTPSAGSQRLVPETFSFCVICGDRGVADLMLNVAFFVPLGVLLVHRFGVLGTVAAGVILSGLVEVLQLSIPGRYSTLADIGGNGLGTLLGTLLHHGMVALGRGLRPPAGAGAALGVVAGTMVCLGGWLLEPSPTDAGYWGQWTPYFGPGTGYPGRVLDARFNGQHFPGGRRLPDSRGTREALRGDWTLEGTIIKGRPPRRLTSILSIYDDRQDEVLLLGAHGDAFVLRERLRAQDWRFDLPELVAHGLLAVGAPGDTMRVVARRIDELRCLEVAQSRACSLAFTPGRLWGLLLYPRSLPPWLHRLADSAFLLTLFFPLGLVAPSWRAATTNGVLAGLLIVAAVLSTRLVWGPALELASACVGLGLGYATPRMTRGTRDDR